MGEPRVPRVNPFAWKAAVTAAVAWPESAAVTCMLRTNIGMLRLPEASV